MQSEHAYSHWIDDIEKSCSLILKTLQEEYGLDEVITDISNIIKEGGFTYAEGFDKICFIIDRDRESFVSSSKSNQYRYVVDRCEEMGFGLYVTNPCFEFWLLLHFDKVFELDRDKLLENPKVTAKRRYVEHELRRACPGYKKTSYRAEGLVKDIDFAIDNEKKFCEDVVDLEHLLGSNIGKLIMDMRAHRS